MTGRLDKVITVGLMVAIVFTTLAHGAVEAWSVALFELMATALMLLWALKMAADKQLKIMVPPPALPIVALLLLGLAQSIAFTDGTGYQWSLSLDVEATRMTVTVLFFLLAIFIMSANFFGHPGRLSTLAKFLVIYGLTLAFFSLIQHFTWNGSFYWLRPTTSASSPFGPFVNRNHFAGYMELLIAIPVGLIVTGGVRGEARLFYGLSAAMMGIAAIFSLSRGGMISLFAETLFIVAVSAKLARHERSDHGQSLGARLKKVAAVAAIIIVIALGVIWIGIEPVINRMATGQTASVNGTQKIETFSQSRGWIWRDTWTLIQAHPFVGVGLGAFQTAYPIYSQYDGSLGMVSEAHNDYLQVLADGGLVGGALALWFIVVIFRAIFRGLRSRNPLLAGLALGSGAGIFGLLVHSLFDFNLQLPSNSLLFLLLSAVASYVSETVAVRGSAYSRHAAEVNVPDLAIGTSS